VKYTFLHLEVIGMVRKQPVVLGIVGDSAAGKNTITQGLVNLLGPESVTHVCTDDYHKYDRKERAERGITPLNPDCNFLDVLEQHIERLHNGQPILKPVYDHATGKLIRPEYVQPKQFVVVEGLLSFSSPTLRQFFDVKVYLDPPEEVRKQWKIKRDTIYRGYTTDEVLAEMERREPDSREFIRPQRMYADLVVRFYPPSGVSLREAGPNLNVRLVLRPTIPHPDLTYLDAGSTSPTNGQQSFVPGVRLQLGRDEGRPVDFLEIDGDVTAHHAAELEDAVWSHLPDLRPLSDDQFGEYNDGRETRHSSPLALTQLLIVYHLVRRYSDLAHRNGLDSSYMAKRQQTDSVPSENPTASVASRKESYP
jgi:phosphoribulokinase